MRRSPVLFVVAIAAAVRLAYLVTVSGGTWQDPVLDADTNLVEAQRWLEGGPGGPFWQPPLYPWLLSLCLRLTPSLWLPRLLLCALSCGTAALTCSLARLVTGRRAPALVAGLLVALHGPLVYYDGDLLPTSLGTFLGALALWVSLRLPDGLLRGWLSGALVGLATLAVGPLALLALPAALWTTRPGWGRADYAAAVLVGAGLVLSPVIRHNRLEGGGNVVALSGGINLWIGNNPAMNEAVAIRPGAAWGELADEPARLGRVQSPRAYDDYFFAKVRGFCAAQPGRCALNFLEKARQLASSIEVPRNESLYEARKRSPVLAALVWRVGPAGFPWGVLWPLAAAGLVSLRGGARGADLRPRRRWLALALLALAAGPLLFFVAGRYRVPMVPALAVFAGVGFEALRRQKRAAWVAAGAALSLALWPPGLPVERVNYEAEQAYLIAGVRQRQGDLEGAERSLAEALRSRPDYLEAAVNLGLLCARQGRRDEAARWLRQALQHHPDDPVAREALRQLAP